MFSKEASGFWSVIKPKTGFFLGIIVGILIIIVIGFFVLLGFYLDGTDSGFGDSDSPRVVNNNGNLDSGTVSVVNIRDVQKSEFVRGGKNALVTMIEYSDFQCPFCARVHSSFKQVMEEYGDQVAWVYRHFPLDSIHPYARKTAEGSECAGDQNKFWEFADATFADNSVLNQGEAGIKQIASSIGLNMNKFNNCLESGKYVKKVNDDYQEGLANGVTGTPATFINGQLVKGAVPFDTFKQIIDSLLE